jgi:hypothetical protein
VKTECYWKCYSYGDDLIPIFEFIDDLRNRSVKELLSANSEQTEEHIEKQDKVRLIFGLSVLVFLIQNFNSILLCFFPQLHARESRGTREIPHEELHMHLSSWRNIYGTSYFSK